MELSYLNATWEDSPAQRIFSLAEKDNNGLLALKMYGKALIYIEESWFDEYLEDERGRRIQSLAVKFCGLEETDPIAAQLTQVSSRYRSPNPQKPIIQRIGAYSIIRLVDIETDTANMKKKGRYLPFEYSGVDSTWLLSFPAAVKDIQNKKINFLQKSMLKKLEDVEITIRYTSKM